MAKSVKVLIFGNRTYKDEEEIYSQLNAWVKEQGLKKIHVLVPIDKGTAKIALKWARSKEYKVTKYPLKEELLGDSAEHIRNLKLAKDCDTAIMFWDGKGAYPDRIGGQLLRNFKPLKIIRYDSEED